MKIELSAGKNSEGAWVVTAYAGDDYAGSSSFYGYTKKEALGKAREMVKAQGGLGLYANIIKAEEA